MKNKYIVILKDKQKGTLTPELLNAHVNHLRQLNKSKQLHLCGPFKDNDGAIQIILSKDLETAKKLIEQDPFIVNKYYQSYDINELIEANEENNWLVTDEQTSGNLGE